MSGAPTQSRWNPTWSGGTRLLDLGRGFSVVDRKPKLPSVQRVALRIKGYPWTVAAPGTQKPSPPPLRALGTAIIHNLSAETQFWLIH